MAIEADGKVPIIVGIDPGTTSGIAVMDLSGNLIFLGSRKNLSRGDIFRLLMEFGIPVIVASDITPSPRTVEKIASTFSAKLVAPSERFRKREKLKLFKQYSQKALLDDRKYDKHEKDALVAALFAWNSVKGVMQKVESKLGDSADQGMMDFVKGRLIVYGGNIKDSLQSYAEANNITASGQQ